MSLARRGRWVTDALGRDRLDDAAHRQARVFLPARAKLLHLLLEVDIADKTGLHDEVVGRGENLEPVNLAHDISGREGFGRADNDGQIGARRLERRGSADTTGQPPPVECVWDTCYVRQPLSDFVYAVTDEQEGLLDA